MRRSIADVRKHIEDYYNFMNVKINHIRTMIKDVYEIETANVNYICMVYPSYLKKQAIQTKKLLSHLASHHISVPRILMSKKDQAITYLDQSPVIITSTMLGIEPEFGQIQDHVGLDLSSLHNAMDALNSELIRYNTSFYIDRFLNLLHLHEIRDTDIASTKRILYTYYNIIDSLPRGPNHGDYHTGNMRSSSVNALSIFDFDAASCFTPVIDLATIADRTNFNQLFKKDIIKTKECIAVIVTQYRTKRPLTLQEEQAILLWIPIRHAEIIGTITKAQGNSTISKTFLQQQINWIHQFYEAVGFNHLRPS
jgi:Ser/Thr protein kinase RdoA (MazF antagonist)